MVIFLPDALTPVAAEQPEIQAIERHDDFDNGDRLDSVGDITEGTDEKVEGDERIDLSENKISIACSSGLLESRLGQMRHVTQYITASRKQLKTGKLNIGQPTLFQ